MGVSWQVPLSLGRVQGPSRLESASMIMIPLLRLVLAAAPFAAGGLQGSTESCHYAAHPDDNFDGTNVGPAVLCATVSCCCAITRNPP